MPADALAAIVAEAQVDRLPDEFVAALQPGQQPAPNEVTP
jgi:hypothetical protein